MDPNTPKQTSNALNDLQISVQNLNKNNMNANPEKYYLLVNITKANCQIRVGNEAITKTE